MSKVYRLRSKGEERLLECPQGRDATGDRGGGKVDFLARGEPPQAESQAGASLVGRAAEGSQDVARLRIGGRAGAAARNGHSFHVQHQGFAVDPRKGTVQVVAQAKLRPVEGRAIQGHSVDLVAQQLVKPVAQRLLPGGLGRQFRLAKFEGFGKADNAWHVQGAAAQAVLLATAVLLRFQSHRRGAASHVQRADPFRTIDFVGRKAEQIDPERGDIDRQFADRLRRIAVQQHATRAANRCDLGQRLQDANLVVRQHHRDQARLVAQSIGDLLRIEPASGWGLPIVDRQQRDFKSAPPQVSQRIEDRFVFGGDTDQVIAAAASAFGDTADRQVVALSRAAGKDDLLRGSADRRCDAFAGGIHSVARVPAERVADAARVAEPFVEVRQHRFQHARIDRRGGVVVEIDRTRCHACYSTGYDTQMPAYLYLEALPPNTTKGTIVRLIVQLGELEKHRIGTIELSGRRATVEVPEAWLNRLVKALDNATLGHQHIRAWRAVPKASVATPADDHFRQLLRWIDQEAAAEADAAKTRIKRLSPADAERTGSSLVNLTIRDETTGLGSRVLVTLGKRDLSQKLPWTRLGVGSPVLLSEEGVKDSENLRGIVSQRGSQTIEVALARWPEPQADRPTFRIDLSSDEVARDRQRFAMQRALAAEHDRLSELRAVLLGERAPKFADDSGPRKASEEAAQFNASQNAAIAFALAAEDVAIIHGPPGTGKTTTVCELIRQAVARGEKVLACAPSNLAVDNMLERLLRHKLNAVRLGHPARVLPELREHTLDLMVENHPDLKVARQLVREANQLRNKASRYTRAKPEPGARQQLRAEAKQLEFDAERIERQVVAHLLDRAEVLCVTLTGLDSEVLGARQFDLAVIDEACQSTEPACWIPLLRSQRVVLAGDHFQLPPTVVSHEAERAGFGISLQERLIERFGAAAISRRLTEQYRMHAAIMSFSSEEFYDGELIAADTVAGHLLCDLEGVERSPLTETPLQFIDTAGAGYDEELEPDGESRRNVQEADVVIKQVEALLAAGVAPQDISVIAPYAAQVRHLRGRLADFEIEVDTVDGFQGREKEAIVISLVRSNANGEIGFLGDKRRMNVALTRARRKLIVIGDSATIGGHEFYQRLLAYFELHEAYKTVWEEMYE